MKVYDIDGKQYHEEDMERICRNVASNWGAQVQRYEVRDGEIVIFCIEAGDKFITSISFNEVSEYDY
jgi:hypothetical protein